MLTSEDIKKLTKYQAEAFKDVFATKIDLKNLEGKINTLQTSVDNLTQMVKGFQEEMIANRHRIDRLEEWARKVSAKTGIPIPF